MDDVQLLKQLLADRAQPRRGVLDWILSVALLGMALGILVFVVLPVMNVHVAVGSLEQPTVSATAQATSEPQPTPTTPPIRPTALTPARTDPLPASNIPAAPAQNPIVATAAPPVPPANGNHPAVVPVIDPNPNAPEVLKMRAHTDDETVCLSGWWYIANAAGEMQKSGVSCSAKGGD